MKLLSIDVKFDDFWLKDFMSMFKNLNVYDRWMLDWFVYWYIWL